jgi:argininosuccinate lyase
VNGKDKNNNQDKPWGGRFKEDLDKRVEAFTASLPFDRRLAAEDIVGSMAHGRMLLKTGIIAPREGEMILKGLQEIGEEISRGEFPYDLSLEDIHMNIEKRLIDKIGSTGGKLHTARSRNDQVALDMHLYVKRELREVEKLIAELQEVILDMAHENLEVIVPGYTHLQRAQPVLLSHHLMAYFWMLQRDRERFLDAYKRADLMPLGAGALSGTSFPIDREEVARELGFSALYENSMDAVSDRDFVLEFLSCSCLLLMHLSRLSEELVLWSSHEFSFLELGDAFTTGSSMMPQKKNPDVPELVRAKTGRVYGNLMALLTVFKGLPLTYNKDMQEDKEPLFDSVDTVKNVLNLYVQLLKSIEVCREKISSALQDDFSTATELADYLACKGVSFREAHHVIGRLVRHCLDEGKLLKDLSSGELTAFHPLLGSVEALARLSPGEAVKAKKCRGGTAPEAVKKQLQAAREALNKALFEKR